MAELPDGLANEMAQIQNFDGNNNTKLNIILILFSAIQEPSYDHDEASTSDVSKKALTCLAGSKTKKYD